MHKIFVFVILFYQTSILFAQSSLVRKIKEYQLSQFDNGSCLDFVRNGDIDGLHESDILQIVLIRHGEPAMHKKGWRNRDEAIDFTRTYDSVGVYPFENKPICLRQLDIDTVYTSALPRAINTAERTFEGQIPLLNEPMFNEFERKIIEFPNIKLPMRFWSVTTRLVWMMGFNDKGIESFREAKRRSERAASLLDIKALDDGKVILFAHGFLNRSIKKYLKQRGYEVLNLDGQKYLGAYYFYKIRN